MPNVVRTPVHDWLIVGRHDSPRWLRYRCQLCGRRRAFHESASIAAQDRNDCPRR